MTNTNSNFIAKTVFTFQHSENADIVTLYSGIMDKKPCYRINSKKIPITGEFTGFPVSIMVKWFEEIGYTLLHSTRVVNHNRFRIG